MTASKKRMTKADKRFREAMEELYGAPAKLHQAEIRVNQLQIAIEQAMKTLDNPPGITFSELAKLNVKAWKILRLALATSDIDDD